LLTPLGAVVWLLAASVVGVVGSILLEGARVAAPIGLAPALIIIVPVELACYLLALGAGVPRLPRVRTTLGAILGLALRGALALILALVAPSPLSTGGVPGQFLLYYARLWPTALVQVLAVTAFLWLIRDLLAVRPPAEKEAVLPPAGGDEGERQKQLLEALLEPTEPQPAPPLPIEAGASEAESPPRSRLRRSRRRGEPAPQSPLIGAEPPPAPARQEQETALALPTEPAADDTAALPLVQGPPAASREVRPIPPGAEE
jgi:hypothetical protein